MTCQGNAVRLPANSADVIIAHMRKMITTILLLVISLSMVFSPQLAQASTTSLAPQNTTPYAVVDAVNALRAQYGLSPYTPNPILMQIAQTHADYMMSTGNMGHINGEGLKPFQRALQAGYAVAGDIYTSVGWFSENIVAGTGMTAEQAVEEWAIMDELHLNTMISPNLMDIGAGVAVSGDYYIYVIDCGRSTGGTAVPLVPQVTYTAPLVTQALPESNADGSVTYTVQANDTLVGIAARYGVSLDTIYTLNNLNGNSVIYVDDVIILSPAFTSTPIQLTGTPTNQTTFTPRHTDPATETTITSAPTSQSSGGLPVSAAGVAVGLIIGTALIMAFLLTLLGKKKNG